MWNIFSVCLSRSAESATETISLALHSVSHALNLQLSESSALIKIVICFLFAVIYRNPKC